MPGISLRLIYNYWFHSLAKSLNENVSENMTGKHLLGKYAFAFGCIFFTCDLVESVNES